MRKTILTIFATALLTGIVFQAASARERYYVGRAYRAAPVAVGEPYRDAYAYDLRYGLAYADYRYWAIRGDGGVTSAPAGH